MVLGRDNYLGIIALCSAALIVAHAAFFVAAATVYHRGAAALTTILLSFYLTHAYYTGGTNRTETFLVAAEMTGVALYLRGFARDRWWKWYAAGLCCGVAFLFKQVGLAGWGCMGLHLIVLMATRRLRLVDGVRRGVLLVLGAATPVGAAAAVLAAQGVLYEAVRATFLFNRAYFAVGDSQFPYSYVNTVLLTQHVKPILLLPLLMAAAAMIHSFLWWLRPQYRPPEIEARLRAKRAVCPLAVGFFAAWFVVAMYGAMISPGHYRHYVVPAIPPLLLLAGYLINVLRAEVRLVRRLQQRAWVTTAFVVMAYFAWEAVRVQFEQVARVALYRIEPYYRPNEPGVCRYEPAEWEVVGDAVAKWAGPDDRVQCWGYMPGVYLRARRLNACRYTTTEKVGQVRAQAQDIVAEIEQTLRARPPEVLVVSSGDWYWMDKGQDDAGHPSEFKLGPWIAENYRRVEEIPQFSTIYIFERKDRVTPASGPKPGGPAARRHAWPDARS